MCEVCANLAVNPACVRCDIVICDMCLYHYDSQCMCTARAAALTAAHGNFGSRKGVSIDSSKRQIDKKVRFDDMFGWYEENHNGDWFEVMYYVDVEPTKEALFYKDRLKDVPDPKITPWILKRDRDKTMREAARLYKVVYPESEFKKSNKSYVDQCTAATRRTFILDSGASADLVGQQGLDKEEQKKVKRTTDTLNVSTDNGLTVSQDEVDLDVPKLGIKIKPHILEDCPDALSIGIRCDEQGFGFYWDPFSYQPKLIRPDGRTIRCSYEKGGGYQWCLLPSKKTTLKRKLAHLTA